MKKIIVAFEGSNFSENIFQFVVGLYKLQPLLLSAVFLPHKEMIDLWDGANPLSKVKKSIPQTTESIKIHTNITHFEKLCHDNFMSYCVHGNYSKLALSELIKESPYADLIILENKLFYNNIGSLTPFDYLKDAIHRLACPVLLLPHNAGFPQSIILTYDETEESVNAIKQFIYMFPEFDNFPALLIYSDDEAEEIYSEKTQIEELLTRHFTNLTVANHSLQPKKVCKEWLKEKTAMLVGGSTSSWGVSQLFKTDLVKNAISDQRLPVFIAHL